MQHIAVENSGATLNQGRGGFKEQVGKLTEQITDVAKGIPNEVARAIAGFVQSVISNPKGAFTVAIAGAAVAQAHGVELISPVNLQNGATTQSSNLVDVENIGGAPWRFHGTKFSISGSEHALTNLTIRGLFTSGPDSNPTYYSPYNPEYKVLTAAIYQVDGSGNISAATSPLKFERFQSGQINVSETGLTNSQGLPIHSFSTNFTNTTLIPGDYLLVTGTHWRDMIFNGVLPTLKVGMESSTLGNPRNNFLTASNIGGGAWSEMSLRGDVALSATPVPEASTLIALGIGGSALLALRKRRER